MFRFQAALVPVQTLENNKQRLCIIGMAKEKAAAHVLHFLWATGILRLCCTCPLYSRILHFRTALNVTYFNTIQEYICIYVV